MKGTLKQSLCCLLTTLMVLAMVGCRFDGAGTTDTSGTDTHLQTTVTEPELDMTGEAIPDPTGSAPSPTDETDLSEDAAEPSETTKAADPDETEPVQTDSPAADSQTSSPKHNHSYSASGTAAPGCESQGYTTYKCACGNSYKDNYTAALGHSYGSWATTKEATTTTEGIQTRTCSHCGKTETQKIAKISGHVHDYYRTVKEPTCTTEGYTLYVCKTCPSSSEGALYEENRTAALGHFFSNGTCTRCGQNESGKLDYAAAEAYGNQYGKDTYGFIIDYSLNFDNAGFNFPYTASVEGINSRGGQPYLNDIICDVVDGLYDTLMRANGTVDGCAINCDIYADEDGTIYFYVYYG